MVDLTILLPVYQDADSLAILLSEIKHAFSGRPEKIQAIAVDDASPSPIAEHLAASPPPFPVTVVRLNRNIGHQAAIAVGLAWLDKENCTAPVAIMDSDGEDDPAALPDLLDALRTSGTDAIVARRSQRRESFGFQIGYHIYKKVFSFTTGKIINFGNYSILKPGVLTRLTSQPGLWWHYAGSLLRSNITTTSQKTPRRARIAGKSHMRLGTLVMHGLRAIAVFSEVVVARMAVAALMLTGLATCGIAAVLAIRLFTTLAIPGWTSFLFMLFAIVILQGFILFAILFAITLAFSPFKGAEHYLSAVDYTQTITPEHT